MYRVEDKPLAIREVQRYLLIISQNDPSLEAISVDGIYTEQTRAAVSQFQQNNAIFVTGTVDKTTFDLLYAEARRTIDDEEHKTRVSEPDKFPLRLGDSGHDVTMLNNNLRSLTEYYIDIEDIPYGSFFSRSTESAVKMMQQHFRENIDGEVTRKLFVRIEDELSARRRFPEQL